MLVTLVAQWYKPVMSFLGKIHDLSMEYPSVVFAIVDMDESPALVSHLGMMAQPGMRLYQREGAEMKKATDITGLNAFNNTTELETILRFEMEKRGALRVDVAANPAALANQIIQQAIHLARPGGNSNQPSESTVSSQPSESGEKPTSQIGTLKLRPQNGTNSPASRSSASAHHNEPAPPKSKYKYFPCTSFELFRTVANMPAIESKIESFAANNAPCTLTAEQTSHIKSLIASIVSSTENGSFTSKSTFQFEDGQLETLEAMLLAWPREVKFPVLDIFRIVLLHPIGRAHFVESPIIPQLLREATASDAPFPFQFMVFKAVCNLFDSNVTAQLVINLFETALGLCRSLATSTNKNLQLSAASLMLNYATFLVQKGFGDDVYNPTPFLDVLVEILTQSPSLSDDALFRMTIAQATMHSTSAISKGRSKEILTLIDKHAELLKTATPPITEHTSTAIAEFHKLCEE